jgi:2-haloacid dehalogenase
MDNTGSAIKAVIFDAYGTLFDTQSVIGVLEATFPGRGGYLTQIWRLKQLEYSWLRSLSDDYQDFRVVTREALRYSLGTVGLEAGASQLERLVAAYDRLALFSDAFPTLQALSGRRLGVFSNGKHDMLAELLNNAGISGLFVDVISVDAVRAFKPSPLVYRLACDTLQLPPDCVLLVSSNGFDIYGASRFGLKTARVERLTTTELRKQFGPEKLIGPAEIFRTLRTQLEDLGAVPDVTVNSLLELPEAIASM